MRQTASDYTLVVNDPPVDAYDPAEWIHYFKPYGKISGVTILVDNGDVLERLARRRSLKLMIESMPDDLFWPGLHPIARKVLSVLGAGHDKVYALELYQKNEQELRLLLQQPYLVRKVYVTFEEEKGVRTALATLQQGKLPAALDVPVGLTEDKLFRSWRSKEEAEVLDLAEAPEPEEICFQNTGLSSPEQQTMQRLVMLMFLGAFCLVEFNVVQALETRAPQFAGLIITVANSVVPEILHVLSGLFEVHETEASKLESVYNKISFFRYFNTVIIIHLITDWSHTLDEEHLAKVQSILIFDAFLTPFLYAFNVAYYINRYVVARLVTNEFELRHVLCGARVRLSDRYSNLAKCMFVGLFYLPLLPTGAFLAFFHCALSCLADRIGLIHQWARMPPAGAKTLFRVLSIHVGVAILTHLYMGSYFYSGWSFDSSCAVNKASVAHYTGVSPSSLFYECDRGQLHQFINAPQTWMNDSQYSTVLMYQVSGRTQCSSWYRSILILTCLFHFLRLNPNHQVVFIAAIVLVLLAGAIIGKKVIQGLFVSSFSIIGEDQGISFYDAPGIHLYVPKYDVPILKFPLVACDLRAIDEDYIEWNSPECEIAKYSLYKDVQPLVKELGVDAKSQQLWSICTQYKKTKEGQKQSNTHPAHKTNFLTRVKNNVKAIV
jgi:hypothetical protein